MQKTNFARAETTAKNGWLSHGEHDAGMGGYSHMCEVFTKGGCKVLVSHEDHGKGRMRWHLSISREDRYPGWPEIKDARYSLLPDHLTFAQILPPSKDYTNIHRNCFHLWEIDDGEW